MSDGHNSKDSGRSPGDLSAEASLSIAALLRAGADGELSSAEERQLETHLESNPADAARIESELLLREAIARVAAGGLSSPVGLHDRVAAALSQLKVAVPDLDALDARREAVALQSPSRAESAADLPTRMAPSTRDRSFWSDLGVWKLSAAAAVVAVGALSAIMLLSQPKSLPEAMMASRTAAVQFVAKEHGRCFLDLAPGAEKFKLTSSAGLPEFASQVIGKEVALADLVATGAENLRFIDAGPCGVPRGGRSMHLRFEMPSADGTDPTAVSLFVQRYTGELGLDEGTTYELDPSASTGTDLKSPTVYIWLRDGLAYYLVIDNAQACPTVRQEMAAPGPLRPLASAS